MKDQKFFNWPHCLVSALSHRACSKFQNESFESSNGFKHKLQELLLFVKVFFVAFRCLCRSDVCRLIATLPLWHFLQTLFAARLPNSVWALFCSLSFVLSLLRFCSLPSCSLSLFLSPSLSLSHRCPDSNSSSVTLTLVIRPKSERLFRCSSSDESLKVKY